MCLLWWPLLCPVFFWDVVFCQNHSRLSFSFPLLITSNYCSLFYFLSSILLEFSKCLISQNIGCLFKTQLKNSTPTIFQGSSPWATLILNSVFVVVVLYCVPFFWDFFCQNHFLLSFSFHLLICFSFLLS